ncbi:MAG: murein biosynthesis integral membrane protein MurJ [Salaquimonas sp.]
MGLLSKFFSVGSATMASRVLGFVREALIAAFLGAGPVADAFYAAFRFPNLFRRLFAEGAFNTAFIPLFSSELETGDKASARKFAEEVLASLLAILLVLSALAMIFMPFLVGTIIAPKFANDPEKFELTVLLTRIMFPFLTAMSIVAMFSGILNSFRRYFLAALAPVIMNIVFITVLVGSNQLGYSDYELGVVMAWGVTLSGLLQIGLLSYAIVKEGFPLSLRWPRFSKPVLRLMKLAVPTAIAAGIAQVNLLVGQIIASGQDGAISIMNYADRLMQLPLGLIAVSIGVVLLPELSRSLSANENDEAIKLQNRSMEFGLGLMIPAAVGLYLMAAPLIALIYERGAFTRELTEVTAQVLSAFALGLPAVVLTKVFQPSYYARKDMRTPMWFAGINAIVNIVLALYLFPIYGVVGLGYAFSTASWVNAFLLGGSLAVKGHYKIQGATLKNISLICLASALMGGVVYFGQNWLSASVLSGNLFEQIGSIGLIIAVAAIVYFAVVVLTGAIPRSQIMRLVKRGR